VNATARSKEGTEGQHVKFDGVILSGVGGDVHKGIKWESKPPPNSSHHKIVPPFSWKEAEEVLSKEES